MTNLPSREDISKWEVATIHALN